MRRYNSEGIDRGDVLLALNTRERVRLARRKGRCMVCLSPNVTAAGLCEGCLATLTDDELEAARPWIEGREVC
ncbi:MAG: hypothetical protein IH851_03900 [Armatimonadetes bacterium]|nr:hypothetical protein [Armatimonadota bacterium]